MPTSNTYPRSAAEWDTYPRSAAEWDASTTNQPPFDSQRAATLQTQPAPNWNRLRTDDLLVDAAFVVAHTAKPCHSRRKAARPWPARSAAAATC